MDPARIDPTLAIIIAIAVIAIIGAVIWFARKRRSDQLRSQFGPEYERTVRQAGDRGKAESQLLDREKRVKALSIRPLAPEERDRFTGSWRQVQTEFVDDPSQAISRSDALVADVMSARGYPVSNFDQVAEDISVDHPTVVQHYRAAHEVAERHERGQASTEDLRKGMIHYRELFAELVGEPLAEPGGKTRKTREETPKVQEETRKEREETGHDR